MREVKNLFLSQNDTTATKEPAMNKLNLKSALVLATLALSACNSGGGGQSGNNTVTVPGVTQKSYPGYRGITCNVGSNTYQCMGNGYTGVLHTFSSLQDMCNQLQMDPSNVDLQERQMIIAEQCRQIGIGQGFNQGFNQSFNGSCPVGTILQNSMCISQSTGQQTTPTLTADSKILNCRVQANIGEEWSGDHEMQIVANKSANTNLFAVLGKNKSYLSGLVNTFRTTTTMKYADINVKLVSVGQSGQADLVQVSLRTKGDDSVLAKATGFAGTTTAVQVVDESIDGLNISVECRASDAVNLVKINNPTQYRCAGVEVENKQKNQLSMQKPISLDWQEDETQLSSTVSARTEGSALSADGVLTVSQTSSRGVSVITKSSLATTSSIKVSRSGYSMDLTCRPSL